MNLLLFFCEEVFMATKVEKKNTIRKLIIESAKSYSEKLAGKTFLYVYGDEYFEILFKTDKFKHLTGVDSKISAVQFYKYAKESKLTTSQFGFSKDHPYSNALKKLTYLARLHELTDSLVCVLKDMNTVTVTYKIGLTNLDFTLCLVNDTSYSDHNWFLPMSLRIKDKAIENSRGGEFVDFIFVKEAAAEKYGKVLFSDSEKSLPDSVLNMLSDDLFKKL